MYAKYQTDALVLGSMPRGEADRYIALYTREFGLVRARASAVRKESSRMRYSLMHYTRTRASLVRGAGGWRVAGAATFHRAPTASPGTAAFARIALLVARLVPGEEKNDALFSILADAHAALTKDSCDTWATVELLCVARVLHALGYLSPEAGAVLFTHTAYAHSDVAEAETHREALLSSVNRALSETQL